MTCILVAFASLQSMGLLRKNVGCCKKPSANKWKDQIPLDVSDNVATQCDTANTLLALLLHSLCALLKQMWTLLVVISVSARSNKAENVNPWLCGTWKVLSQPAKHQHTRPCNSGQRDHSWLDYHLFPDPKSPKPKTWKSRLLLHLMWQLTVQPL